MRGRVARHLLPVSPASPKTALEYDLARQKEKQRDRCSVCGQRYEWFQLDGSGRGPECQP